MEPSPRQPAPPTILVLDADPQARHALRRLLECAAYRGCAAIPDAAVLALIAQLQPDLVIVDVQLPDGDGFALCHHIHAATALPLLVVSARTQVRDKVHALRVGADAYLTKPVHPNELLACVAARLRRVREYAAPHPSAFACGPLRIAFAQQRVWLDGQAIHLSATEYRLLAYLARHAGRICATSAVIATVWGAHYGDATLLAVYIRRLRRKLGEDTRRPRLIHTHPGQGYRLATDADGDAG